MIAGKKSFITGFISDFGSFITLPAAGRKTRRHFPLTPLHLNQLPKARDSLNDRFTGGIA
jgi:hypothetical protein